MKHNYDYLAAFIEKANKVHNNKYSYDKNMSYIDIKTKMVIVCPTHGEFYQNTKTHIYLKCGCPKCGRDSCDNIRASNTDTFIKQSKEVHGDLYNHDNVVYINNHTNVTINCKKHGDFCQRPVKHILNKSGCPRCVFRFQNQEEFIQLSSTVHNNLYEYTSVEYKRADVKVDIICKIHGQFKQTPASHVNGTGCPKCARMYAFRGYSMSTLNGTDLGSIPGMVYFIKIQDHELKECFYKIGITKRSVSQRFSEYKYSKSISIDVLICVPLTLYEAYVTEQNIISKYSDFAYFPQAMINKGATECFKLSNDQVLDVVSELSLID